MPTEDFYINSERKEKINKGKKSYREYLKEMYLVQQGRDLEEKQSVLSEMPTDILS